MKGFGEKYKSKKKSDKKTKPSKEQIINQAFKFHSEGNFQKAEKYYKKFIDEGYKDYRVFYNYGIILKKTNNLQNAELSYRKAIEIKPDFAEAHYNLGNILKDRDELQEAEISYGKAIELKPDFADAISNLGNVLRDLGKLQEAELSLRKVIQLKSNSAEVHYNLGNILRDLGYLKEAEETMRKAIELKPDFADAIYNLGIILRDLGKFEESRKTAEKCVQLEPNDLAFNLQSKLFITNIPLSKYQIEEERNELNKQISIIAKKDNMILKRNISSIDFIFSLAYHNCENDKAILENIATNLSKINGVVNKSFNIERQIKSINSRTKMRLGICSDFIYNHAISKCYLNIIKDFVDEGIEVILFRNRGSKSDSITNYADSIVSEKIILPESLEKTCQMVLSKSIDILLYLDSGMSPKTYLMSLSRLALVQALTDGHISTSGVPNIDYYISSKHKETDDSDKYYSERLIRLNRLPESLSMPKIQAISFKRSDINISNKEFLIGVPHSLFKFHPDFDFVLEKIIEEIPHAYIFLFEGTSKSQLKQIKSRWKKNNQSFSNRMIIYPRVGFEKYLEIMKSFDITLDPLYSGVGHTMYHAMFFGVPMVSMPTNQARGRYAYALYKQMDVANPPIAKTIDEYISLCKKLAFNTSYRNEIKSQIIAKSKENLFRDKTIVKEYIEFFHDSIKYAKEKKILPLKWKPSIH